MYTANFFSAVRCLGFALAALILASSALAGVQLEVAVSPDPPQPGEMLELEITVANDGPFDLTDLTVLFDFPPGLNPLFSTTFAGNCPGGGCSAGEQATFLIGFLEDGHAVTYTVPLTVASATANGTIIPFDVAVIDDTIEQASDTDSVTVDATRELELALGDDVDPALPGETVTYTLTYGLIDTSAGKAGVTLRFPLPSGTVFIDASDGGVDTGGLVEWNLGNLDPGDGGERRVRVSVGAGTGMGTILRATTTIEEAGGDSVVERITTRVTPDNSLELAIVASPDAARPDELIDVELAVTNDGAFDRTGVTLSLLFPQDLQALFSILTDGVCPGGGCTATESLTFDLGTIRSGEGITRSVPLEIGAATLDGTVIPLGAEVTDSTGGTARADAALRIEGTRELELELSQERDSVTPGNDVDYMLSFGVLDPGAGATGAVLTLPVPVGTTFVSATDGGIEAGGLVTWNLGDLDPGATGERHVRVSLDAGEPHGTSLLAEARLEALDQPPVTIRNVCRIEARTPLNIDVITSPDPAQPGEMLDAEITVTNSGSLDRTDVELVFETPQGLEALFSILFDGICPGGACTLAERATFSLGTLGPGEGTTFTVPIQVASAMPSGSTIDLEVEARDADGDLAESATGFTVDASRVLELALVESDEPVAAGDALTYTLVYGAADNGGGIANPMLELTIPDQTTFVSASDGGSESGGVISWPLSALNPGSGGSRTAIVAVDSLLDDGELLRARARFIDPAAPRTEVHFEETTRIQQVQPFDLDLIVTQGAAAPDESLDLTLTLRNDSGFDRIDVTVRLETPDLVAAYFNSQGDGVCPGGACTAGESVTVTLPTLLAGETQSFQMPFQVGSLAILGGVINLDADATDITGFRSVAGDAVMVGTVFDAAGPKPAAGAGAVPDGSVGEPLRVERLSTDTLLLSWSESCSAGDDDYAVYVGTIGDFTMTTPLTCSTGGAEALVLLVPSDNQFFLVVPSNGAREGSYGQTSSGAERPVGVGACFPQQIETTCDS